MGDYLGTCMVTKLPIKEGDRVVAFLLNSNPIMLKWERYDSYRACVSCTCDLWSPRTVAIRGTYSELDGWIKPDLMEEYDGHISETMRLLQEDSENKNTDFRYVGQESSRSELRCENNGNKYFVGYAMVLEEIYYECLKIKVNTRNYKFSKKIVMEALPLLVDVLEKANSDLTKPISYRQFDLFNLTKDEKTNIEFINLTICAGSNMGMTTAPNAFRDYCFRIIPGLNRKELIDAYVERLIDLYIFNRFLEITNRTWDVDLTRRGDTFMNVHLPILRLAKKIAGRR
jgi:hypothetical protein